MNYVQIGLRGFQLNTSAIIIFWNNFMETINYDTVLLTFK